MLCSFHFDRRPHPNPGYFSQSSLRQFLWTAILELGHLNEGNHIHSEFGDLITLGQGSGPKVDAESVQSHRVRHGAGGKQAMPHLTLCLSMGEKTQPGCDLPFFDWVFLA